LKEDKSLLFYLFGALLHFFLTHKFSYSKMALRFFSDTKMKNILKNRWALSTVVTTLIILVVSVLLAGVVTYFAINVTSTRVQEESLALEKLHVWCPQDSSTSPQAAFLIINTGGRDVVISKITIRGQEAAWTKVWYSVTDKSVTNDFSFTTLSGTPSVNIGSASVTLAQGSNQVTLNSGKSMVVYIDGPDSITINDIGLTVGITVFTSQAMYYQEANVQAYVAGSS
jgi:hypothetical protein